MNNANLLVFYQGAPKISNTDFELVERKGVGHPDTLCDTIAEKISQAYSLYCLERYGTILRHMVDKIALAGGATKVHFGGGEMKKPIRLYLNCRFTRICNGEQIPYQDIVKEVVYKHFGEVMPLLDTERWLTIVDNTHSTPGPGVVYRTDGSTQNERQFFFEVPDENYKSFHENGLRSNDTSTAVAYSPLSPLEQMVIMMETTLNSKDFKINHPCVGTDIKVMAKRIGGQVGLTICVPFIARYTPSEDFYYVKISQLKKLLGQLARQHFPQFETTIDINTRDNPQKSDYYLTLVGSAIESGDEGAVGRGNRHNGVIPFARHMSMEACCGKNPVYHVGKIYTAVAQVISDRIYDRLGLESYIYLTSQMGRSLFDPWQACVEICGRAATDSEKDVIAYIVETTLQDTPKITQKIICGELTMF